MPPKRDPMPFVQKEKALCCKALRCTVELEDEDDHKIMKFFRTHLRAQTNQIITSDTASRNTNPPKTSGASCALPYSRRIARRVDKSWLATSTNQPKKSVFGEGRKYRVGRLGSVRGWDRYGLC